MLSSWSVAIFGLVYIGILFSIAYFGDKRKPENTNKALTSRNLIYSLSLAVYCSSWTFYGAVGTAASVGYDYLAIFLGPCLVYLLGYKVIRRIIIICKTTNITSISDFIASRFGKSRRVAVLVTIIAVFGSIPYIALQLKAISTSFTVVTLGTAANASTHSFLNDTALYVTIALAVFTIFFGTRHLNAAEHHQGLILAVAFESIVKLVAILAIGYYAVFLLLDNLAESGNTLAQASVSSIITEGSTWQSFLTKTLLAMSAIILLPRQFHVTIVEANDHSQFKTAAWVMTFYLILTSIVVVPIAVSGLFLQPSGQEDLYVLTLPLQNGNSTLAMIAFIGGASAATGMVIVASIALSTMISNDWVMPSLLSSKRFQSLEYKDLSRLILLVRRAAIVGLLLLAYVYYGFMDSNQRLANIGLTAFAATAQLVPAIVAALFWKRANKQGVFWGLIAGFSVWVYCLLIPTITNSAAWQQSHAWFNPQALFGMTLSDPLTHGTFWSLFFNTFVMIFVSLRTQQDVVEQVQANFYATPYQGSVPSTPYLNEVNDSQFKNAQQYEPRSKVPVTVAEIKRVAEKFIGVANTSTLLKRFENRQDVIEINDSTVVDMRLLSQIHTAIGGVVGVSSAQKIMSDDLSVGVQFYPNDSPIIRETSDVLRFNRNLMQTTLENISQGISVVDEDLNLVIWNDRYIELFNYPKNLIYSGMPVRDILEFNASRGEFGPENVKAAVQKRLRHLVKRLPYEHISTRSNDKVIKHIGNPMPSGGYVTSYQDITSSVAAAKQLEKANEDLEHRVKERTKELENLAQRLEVATQSKTNFLAAASHDLLQPINAARLFSHSIRQRKSDASEVERLAERVELSLNNANQLLSALLNISKLDGGGITPEVSRFDISELIHDICAEFEESAQLKSIEVRSVASSVVVETDRNLLFSVLQNFVSNAIRYSNPNDKILIGVRKRKSDQLAEIQVLDTGIGISTSNLSSITEEFFQIPATTDNTNEAKNSSGGIGLGMAIAKRISTLLGSDIRIQSEFGKGSLFSISVPVTSQIVRVTNSLNTSTNDELKSIEGKTVLCLDNDSIVLDSLVSVLEDWGCEVLAANNFQQAEEYFSEDVDAVLADYQLGETKDGADFLNAYAGHSSKVVGVLITAVKDESLKVDANNGGWHLLRKPVETAQLREILNQLSS